MLGYEGLYRVSDEGQIWSAPRATTRGGLLKLYPDKRGYPWVTLTRDGAQKRRSVHQLVAEAFIGPRPDGLEVRHKDGDHRNARANNLEYGTHAENMQDMVRHGTGASINKTHCPKGHEYTEANTRVYDGRRWCRQCDRDYHNYKGNPLPGDRTHCPKGHPYDEANTYVDKTGRRHCRTCRLARNRAWVAAHKVA